MESTLPVNAQTSPKERRTDILISSFTGSGTGREKIICFITKIAYKFNLATGEPTGTRGKGDMYKTC